MTVAAQPANSESDELQLPVRHLLGDLVRDGVRTIDEWVAAVEDEGVRSTPLGMFELGCAYLYDSRLRDANEIFQDCLPTDGLSHAVLQLAQGKTHNLLAKFEAADHYLNEAVELAAREGLDTPVRVLTSCFYVLNLSDWGRAVKGNPHFEQLESTVLTGAAESVRRHTLSRLLLREGRRQEALAVLEDAQHPASLAALSPMFQAQIARAHGILLTVTSQPTAAREALREAMALFSRIQYRRGMVRSALSLVRTYASLDSREASFYLARCKEILDSTDPPRAPSRPGKRSMPMEWADYHARMGDLAFFQGDFDKSEERYRQDTEILSYLAAGSRDAFKRESGYAYRNLGKSLLMLRNYSEAASALARSVAHFRSAHDNVNAFYSCSLQCDADIRARNFASATSLLDALEGLLHGTKSRAKEQAIVETLRGSLTWLHLRDAVGAHRLIRRAKKALLHVGRDYHYVRALLAEARVLTDTGDRPGARQVLLEAWRRSAIAAMIDLRREAETALAEVGVPLEAIETHDRTLLELSCEREGYVRTELTILFADIRGFTQACTRVDPGQMAAFIGEFAELVSTCVARKSGLPIRFLGDCVMALFGVRDDGNRVHQALEAACEAHELFNGLKGRWANHAGEFRDVGLGFGIATGVVVAGRFGAAGLSEFSVVGEPVNLASRIQGVAEDGQIMLCKGSADMASQALPGFDRAGDPRELDLKGFGVRPVLLFSTQLAIDFIRNNSTMKPPPRLQLIT